METNRDNKSLDVNLPVFEKEARDLVDFFGKMDLNTLSSTLKVSMGIAKKIKEYFYEFSYPGNLIESIKSFDGVVFKNLDFQSLPISTQTSTVNNVKIISSLYGILNLTDTIKPYRLEYNAPCEPIAQNLTKFWKSKITIYLTKLIKNLPDKNIINLLPGDAAKYIDWKLIKAFSKVTVPDFKFLDDMGNLRTPNANDLKKARGLFLRESLIRNLLVPRYDDFETLEMIYSPEDSKTGRPLFIFKNK